MIKPGQRVWVYRSLHNTYLPATVVSVKGQTAGISSQFGFERKHVNLLATKKPEGYK